MNHEGAIGLLEDLLRGKLDADARDEVLAHLDDCRECQTISRTYVTLAESCRGEDPGGEPHPTSAEIVTYAVREDELDEADRERIASHLLVCPTCVMELDATKRAEEELAPPFTPVADEPRRPLVSRSTAKAALAAGVVFALLGYPAFVGLFEMPGIKQRIAALESETAPTQAEPAPAWAGPVQLLYLQSPLRSGDEATPRIEIAAGQPYVTLAVDPAVMQREPSERIGFAVLDGEGRATWSWDVPATELADHMNAGVLTFLVPSERLPEGRLSLRVTRIGDAGARPVYDAPFVVARRP